MDRKDEFDRDGRDVERGAAPDERTGDVLGLGGPIAKSPDDPSTEYDPESVARRRSRMHDGADEIVTDRTPGRTAGATGIDMGAGGSGTDIE